MASPPGEILSWDSRFFGLRIARLTGRPSAEALAWSRAERIDCLYWLADPDDRASLNAAAAAGFELVDLRVTLAYGGPLGEARMPAAIRPAREEDIAALRAIARDSHRDSRFFVDGGFPEERCQALFETWIEASCRGRDRAVLTADANGVASGYCTCGVDESGRQGTIGLFAVAAAARGRGLGRQLLAGALGFFREQGVERVSVVTQGRNYAAQRLYQRSGFCTESAMLWWHRWERRADERIPDSV